MGRVRKTLVIEEGTRFPSYLYGLEGVMSLFHVSKATASRYVNTFLAPAVTRKGNVLFIDTVKALRCFGVSNPASFVKK